MGEKCAVLGALCNVKMEKLGGRKERGERREGVVFFLDARVFSFVKAALSSCRCSLRDERDHLLSLSLSLENEIPGLAFPVSALLRE